MTSAEIAKLVTNVIITTAFIVAASFGKVPWHFALGAIVLVLTPSSLPNALALLRGAKPEPTTMASVPPNSASILDPPDEKEDHQ